MVKTTALLQMVLLMAAAGAGSALPASAQPGTNCGNALITIRAHVARSDTRRLSRCAVAVLDNTPSGEVEALCGRLRTRGTGADLTDARSRSRIERRCRKALPDWLGDTCGGPGPDTGMPLFDGESAAQCAVTSAHCLAVDAVTSLIPDALDLVTRQHPANVGFDLGKSRMSFADCTDLPPATTSTTLGGITTTTLGAPTTTTLASPTTTMPGTTTTMPVTTTLAPTTTTTLAGGAAPVLVVTEIMSNPAAQSDSTGEYFELLNAGAQPVDMDGFEIRDDGTDAFVIDGPMIIPAGGRVVLGKSVTAAGGAVDYVYGSGMTLSNVDDEIVVIAGGEEVDRVAYDASFPLAAGRSLELKEDALDPIANDDAANWCESSTEIGDGDFGSPHGPSDCAP